MNLYPVSAKDYACERCGHVVQQSTNHYGPTWSLGRLNTCPKCPPWAKYVEFGGSTTWRCVTPEPADCVGTIGQSYGGAQ